MAIYFQIQAFDDKEKAVENQRPVPFSTRARQ